MTTFTGFDHEALCFLRDVHRHNSKEWFEGHRNIYENMLLGPFRSLVDSMGMPMRQIDEFIEIRPAIGKTISHLRRDTRFSHDKSLYRNNMWLTFKRPKKDWTDAPTYFFEFGPDWWRYGLGYYSALPATMALFRDRLLGSQHEFQQAVKAIPEGFDVHGESYKRQMVPESLSPELAPWYVKKSFYIANHSKDMAPLSSARLPDTLLEDFEHLSKMYMFLVDVERMKQEQGHSQVNSMYPMKEKQ